MSVGWVFRAVLTGLLMAGLSAAAQDSGSRRLSLRADLLGWEAVGRLDLAGRGFCTGVLIAPDLVLTAAHCIHDRATGIDVAARDIAFSAGLRDGVAVAVRQGATVGIAAEYRVPDADRWAVLRNDVALVRLASPIPAAVAAPFVAGLPPARNSAVALVSYGRDREGAPSWQRRCRTLDQREGIVAVSCDATHGSSGAPILDMSGRRGRIVSLVSAGAEAEGRKVVFGMALGAPLASARAALHRADTDRRSGAGAKFVRP
ncbi:hypothetical protein OCGS_1127 [Oceaniovalibus guishaninsula JLT2003]|uniref:Peptidase S1 domain-containing protein n=1 Tax=Oceaniovalibus guishaninsula JLT2003 TaxID=1231392 RepID=K2HPF6_9RHOB|nr:trypsin-like peptidase domain-containing protein [Oceaniovalibus guishaninsula]EKE44744.1 hypothetical protein OCGS_1127 [Oceaniovalibus guishaninsula JLT2003]